MMGALQRHRRKLWVLAALILSVPIAHGWVVVGTRIVPPVLPAINADKPSEDAGIARLWGGYARVRAGIREVYLEGSPEQIGTEQARLNYRSMAENEQELWDNFAHYVPIAAARTLIMDVSRVKYKDIDRGFPEPRRLEIAAQARAFDPDPYVSHMPTYQRMVFLHSLYDIALSFEHSPLIGCSAFGLGPGATANGHTLLGRAFDFEAGDVFDREKAVFFVRGDAAIPFASVAWPGLVGVMSGMNLEGVAVVVNGGRARDPTTQGEPVVFMLRDVLERAHDTREAIEILRAQKVMVSHIVFVADAEAHFAVVERAPGATAFVRDSFSDADRVAVTNHFEGPLASDPKNIAVRAKTSTLPRRARLDEMLQAIGPHEATVDSAVGMLRDHKCAGGVACPLGDRRAIDALIATHGIVADTTERTLWVSAGPHLSGRFVQFDLRTIFALGHDPATDPAPLVIAEDPIVHDGRYEEGRAHAGRPHVGGDVAKGEP
jgi:isopenicillin-N N-acyltransferase-like protein